MCVYATRSENTGGKVNYMTCCEPIGASSEPLRSCGAHGYGYKWIPDDPIQHNRPLLPPNRPERALAEVQAQGFLIVVVAMLAVWILGAVAAFGGAELPDCTIVISGLTSAVALLGLALSQYQCSKVLELSPLGWMRVLNIATLMHSGTLVLATNLGQDLSSVQYRELVQYGLLLVITYAQEKLLWKPLAGVGIPLATVTMIIMLRRHCRFLTSVFVSLSCAIVLISIIPAFDTLPYEEHHGHHKHYNYQQQQNNIAVELGLFSSETRLLWSVTWPILMLPAVTSYCAFCLGRRRVAFACACVCLFLGVILWGEGFTHEQSIVSLPIFARDDAKFGSTGRWCCVQPTLPTGHSIRCAFGRHSFQWFHHFERPEGTQWTTDVWKMAVITVLTNASGIPVAIFTWRTGTICPAVIAIGTMAFSTLYHLADTIDNTVLGMTEGNWHRLDNIFAILSFISLQIYVLDATIEEDVMQRVRMGLSMLTVVFQEIGPWQLECTLIPILVATSLFVVYLVHNPTIRAALGRNPEDAFRRAAIMLFFGVIGFIKGLNDATDWLRIAHGCWHFFTGLSFVFFAQGLRHVVVEHREKRDF